MHKQQILNHQVEVCFTDAAFVKIEVMGEQTAHLAHTAVGGTLARILTLVQDAAERKAPAELFIRKFARIYTPIVVLLAFLIVALPALVAAVHPGFDYVFNDWLYRGLVFLVISCPCALVISIPLGYFGGIGAASRTGILFKGSNYLDAITRINAVVFDKTGTLTTGSFRVTSIQATDIPEDELLSLVASVEKKSTHPVAQAIVHYASGRGVKPAVVIVHQLRQHGQGTVDGVGVVRQLDGAHAAVLYHEEGHRLNVHTRTGAAAEQVLVGGVLAVKVGAAGGKAKAHLGNRQDGGAVLGDDGLANDGVGVHHLVDLLHGNVHQALNGMLSHKTALLYRFDSGKGPLSADPDTRIVYHIIGRCPILFCARTRTAPAPPQGR